MIVVLFLPESELYRTFFCYTLYFQKLARRFHTVWTLFAHSLNKVCTKFAQSLHKFCWCSKGFLTEVIRIMSVLAMRAPQEVKKEVSLFVFTQFAQSLYTDCSQFAHSLKFINSFSASKLSSSGSNVKRNVKTSTNQPLSGQK